MFEEYRTDILREFGIQENIVKSLTAEKEQLQTEIEMAKFVICEKELCEVAQLKYKETIDLINKDKFLQQGGVIQDYIDKYWQKKEMYQYEDVRLNELIDKKKQDAKYDPTKITFKA